MKKPIKTTKKTYTINSLKPMTEEEKTIQSLMHYGKSRVEAAQYLLKYPHIDISHTGLGKKKVIEIFPPLPKKSEPKSNKLDLKSWQVVVLINSSHKLEGVIFTPSKLNPVKGYFFVSLTSAEFFLKDRVQNPDRLRNELKFEMKKCTSYDIKGGVNFISRNEAKGIASVYERRLLCDYINKALTHRTNMATESEEAFLCQRFKYENRLDKKERNEFLLKQLYKPKNAPQKPVTPKPTLPTIPCEFKDDDVVMYGTGTKADLVAFPKDKAADQYIIPDYVERIRSGAFKETNNLQYVKIGKGVQYIEKEAFTDNTSLVSITIPDTVLTVEERAFTRCLNLRIVFVKSKSAGISSKLFYDCENLQFFATSNEMLRRSMQIIREFSCSNVELKVHKVGENTSYPHLDNNEKIFVMGNIYYCLKHNHSIKSMWMNVQIKEKGIFKYAPICVFRCKNCKKTFILPDVYYYYFRRYDFANTKLFIRLDYDNWFIGKKMKGLNDPLDPVGVLKEAGYNVNEMEGLSHSTRVCILRDIIEFGILSKAEVEQRLQYFINFIGAKAGNELARSKWEEDLIAIHEMKIKRK